jgi:hypothetical protein
MNKATAIFSILLLTSGLSQAENPVVQAVESALETAGYDVSHTDCLHAFAKEIPGNVLVHEKDNALSDWAALAENWNAVFFAADEHLANSARSAGLTVGTIERDQKEYNLVVLDTEKQDELKSWLANG